MASQYLLPHYGIFRPTLLSLCLFGLHGNALAAEKPATLPAVTVNADKVEEADGPVEGYRAERSATATRTDTPVEEVPQSISVISADQIDDQKAKTLQEVLGYTAGVRSATYGMDNRGDWFTLRGSSESSTLLDGLRLPQSGWYGSLRNEPFAFERVEVLRGPSSVMAGQNSPGGVVNLVSKLPQREALTELTLELGNDEHKQLSLDSTGAMNKDGTVLYRVVALAKDAGTQIEHAEEERQYFAPSLTWMPSTDTTVTLYAQYQKDESQNTNAFLPWAGTLYANPQYVMAGLPGYIPSDLFIGEPGWDTYGGERLRVGYQLEQVLNDTWTLRHQLRYDDLEGHLESMYANFWEVAADGTCSTCPSLTEINRTIYGTRTYSEVTNADLMTEGKFVLGNVEHTLLIGGDGMIFNDDQRIGTTDAVATPLDVFNPVYGTTPRPDFDYSTKTPQNTDQYGVFIQDQAKINGKWVAVGSLRWDKLNIEPSNIDDDETSTRLGLVYLADNGLSPYVSYSESFESIAGFDTHGQAFQPKRGKQWETGVKFKPDASNLMLSAATYILTEENRPMIDANDPDMTDSYTEIQAGEVTVKGVELEATGTVDSLDLIANYTYTNAEVTNPDTDAQLVSIPEQSASFWAVNRFSIVDIPGFRAGGGVRYTGETWDGNDIMKTPANAIFDTLLSFEQDNWRYALNINNLFDEDYVVTALGRGDSWFGTRRKVIGSLTYRM